MCDRNSMDDYTQENNTVDGVRVSLAGRVAREAGLGAMRMPGN